MKKVLIIGLAVMFTASMASATMGTKDYKWDGQIDIPDLGSAFAEIVIPFDPTEPKPVIGDLDVDLIIQHTWQGDLIIWLEHVDNGISQELMNRPGYPEDSSFGWSDDNLGNPATGEKFIFDDEAPGPYDPSFLGPFGGFSDPTGSWQPENPLDVFDGKTKWGTWRLHVSDNAGGDTGSILNFSLHMTNVPEPGSLSLLALGGLALLRRKRI